MWCCSAPLLNRGFWTTHRPQFSGVDYLWDIPPKTTSPLASGPENGQGILRKLFVQFICSDDSYQDVLLHCGKENSPFCACGKMDFKWLAVKNNSSIHSVLETPVHFTWYPRVISRRTTAHQAQSCCLIVPFECRLSIVFTRFQGQIGLDHPR